MAFQADSPLLYGLMNPIVNYINSVMTLFVSGAEFYATILIALIISYIVKHKNNWGKLAFFSFAVVLFSALRYIGVGK